MRTILLTIILLLSSHTPALSDVTFEGANNEIVIFTGYIKADEMDDILVEIKAKNPKKMILNSYGGDLRFAGRLARSIHENNISTYVSEISV